MVCAKSRVFVTGLGVISPLGPDSGSNLESLLCARDTVTRVESFDVSRTRCKTAGQIPDQWMEDAFPQGIHSERAHRSARMTTMALREARESAKGPSLELLIVGTTSGGMSYGELYYR